MLSTVFGIVMFVIPVPKKAHSPIVVTDEPNFMLSICAQELNALRPNVVTLLKSSAVIFLQLQKA